jgi:hypothetical protein
LTEAEGAWLQGRIDAYDQWLALPFRRLGNFGGVPHPHGLLAEALPPWLGQLLDKMTALRIFAERPNQVLLNDYAGPGAGIGLHNDGPLFVPRVAIVSLGSPAVLRFRPTATDPAGGIGAPQPDDTLQVLVQPRSLIVFAGAAYTDHVHGVTAVEPGEEDRHEVSPFRRSSLTVRRVVTVAREAGEWGPSDAEEHARRLAWWSSSVSEKRRK